MKWLHAGFLLLLSTFAIAEGPCSVDEVLPISCLEEGSTFNNGWLTSYRKDGLDKWQNVGLRDLPHRWRDDSAVGDFGQVQYRKILTGNGYIDGLFIAIAQPYSSAEVSIVNWQGQEYVAFDGEGYNDSSGTLAPPVIALPRLYPGDQLILTVSNGGYPYGWTDPVIIEPALSLVSKQYSYIAFHILLMGILLSAAFYNFGLWLADRREWSSLLLVCGCLAFTLRFASTGNVLAAFIPEMPISALWRLNWFTAFINFVIWPIFFFRMFRQVVPRIVVIMIVLVFGCATFATLVLPALLFVPLGQVLNWLMMIVIIVYMLALSWYLIVHKQVWSAKSVGIYTIILGALLDSYDYLVGVYVPIEGTTLGVTIFVLFQSYVLSQNYSSSLRREAKLTGQLRALNQSLERQVEARTEELNLANRELEQVARTDKLTNLPNRRAFDEHIKIAFARLRREFTPFAILLVDADHFKKVNDTYGHDVGDVVLKELALVIQECIREVDFPSRIGGEEFSVLINNVKAGEAAAIAERLRRAVEQFTFDRSGNKLSLTVSSGLAFATVDDSIDELFVKADKALYRAKSSGRNRISINAES